MYKNSKFTVILPTVIACSIALGILLGGKVFRNNRTRNMPNQSLVTGNNNKIDMLLSLINTTYVDSVSIDSLIENTIPLIVDELDPHSSYLTKAEVLEANEIYDAQFDGIGVTFNMLTDTVIVLNVITGGPSADAGIQAGDRIITVNDSTIAGVKMPQNSVVKRLRGPRGSQVKLGIQRYGHKGLIPITVTRGAIPIKSILASYMIRPEIGYIRFEQFSGTSHSELIAAISSLKEQGMKKLILDIRGNGGGLLDQAIVIANEFLPVNNMIVYTQNREGQKDIQYSNGKGSFTDEELVVLIDENSASASEILAGALQDNDRGTIIGRRSFGKGLVQGQFPFPDGSALRLTIARYYTPVGRSIQKPYDKGRESYYNEVYDRYEHDEMFTADSIHFNDSLKFTTPGGKVVYGGGGIMPDIFVPIDTSDVTPYFRAVTDWDKNILYRFTLEFSDRNRARLNGINTLEELDRFFAEQPNLLNDFVAFASRSGVSPNAADIAKSKALILSQLKAYIGRNSPLEDNAFYHCIQQIDPVVDKALETLNRPTESGYRAAATDSAAAATIQPE
ncbi:MAG TPA: S41 family peptidase [Candidatus Alistipes pullicola]|nr:S41 family peptidase [Candidatus Alistipes pullicola]